MRTTLRGACRLTLLAVCVLVQPVGAVQKLYVLSSRSDDMAVIDVATHQIIKRIKEDSDLASIPCMLITNYAEHHELAVQAGAEVGFGKLELHKGETHQRLAARS